MKGIIRKIFTFLVILFLFPYFNIESIHSSHRDSNFNLEEINNSPKNNIPLSIQDANFIRYKILWDEAHDPWSYALIGSVSSDFNYVYYEAYRSLVTYGHQVSIIQSGEITTSLLENYDLLIIPMSIGEYTQQEVNTIINWITNLGGSLLIFCDNTHNEGSFAIVQNLGYYPGGYFYESDDYILSSNRVFFSGGNFVFPNITDGLSRVEILNPQYFSAKPAEAITIIKTDSDNTCYQETTYLNDVPAVAISQEFNNSELGRMAYFTNSAFIESKYDFDQDGVKNYFDSNNSLLWLNTINWLIDKENQLKIDNDNDLLPDYSEVLYYNSSTESNDTDCDLLLDYQEADLGTSLINNDTDNDLLGDYDEVMIFHTNPLDNDSDNDDLSDKEEIEITFTDPNNSDTDFDQIPDKAELDLLLDPLDPLDGAADNDQDGLTNYQEYRFKTDLNNNDTDFDKINDYDEKMVYGTSPLYSDSDNDNLTDYDELFWYYTNPVRSDTDSDGYSDYEEITGGSNPLDPDSTPPSPFPPGYPSYDPTTKIVGIKIILLYSFQLLIIFVIQKRRKANP